MMSIHDVALTLARAHRKADAEIREIFLAKDPAGKEVRLLEVSSSVGNTGSILPFRFAAREDLGIPYPSVIVLVSPEEKQSLDNKELQLPESWGSSPELLSI
jgi:hypothetical protein